jgi:acetyl-CoA acetyltransferase
VNFRDKAAIAGIGATEFSKNSGRSELQLAVEAIMAALDEAGLTPADVDGLSTFTMDTNAEDEVARSLGCRDLKFFSRVDYGGGAGGGVILQAAMAVAAGIAETVVVYRAMNERSGVRFGLPITTNAATPDQLVRGLHTCQGLQTPGAFMAMAMRRYMHETGATSADFGLISVNARRNAATNPKAWYYGKPITLEDHQNSRMIADPMRLLDFCQESDGGVALVITSLERARNLKQKPVKIRGASQGLPRGTNPMSSYYRPDIVPRDEARTAARKIYELAGITPDDIDVAIIYDHFGPSLMPALEAYGFCGYGEGVDFVREGHIRLEGKLPVNTNGGQLGEAYIHGMNGFAEAVRQIRGTAVNQIANVEHVLATAGNVVPTSAVILGRD